MILDWLGQFSGTASVGKRNPPACGRKAQGSVRETHTDFLSPNSSVLEKTSVGLIWSVLKSLRAVMTLTYLLSKETPPSRGSLIPLLNALCLPSFRKAFHFPCCRLDKPKKRTGSWEALGRTWEDSEGHPEIQGGVGVSGALSGLGA